MTAPSVKSRKLVETLDDDSSWDDLAYLIHVRQAIARGLSESRDRLGIPLSEVCRRYGAKECGSTGCRVRWRILTASETR